MIFAMWLIITLNMTVNSIIIIEWVLNEAFAKMYTCKLAKKMLIAFDIIKIWGLFIWGFFWHVYVLKLLKLVFFIFSFSELFLILHGGLFYFTKALAAYNSCTA